MNWWILIAQIIGKVGLEGIPLAERLWQKWTTKNDPVQADWDELKTLGAQRANTQMLDALARAGIDPASDQGKKLLGLV